MARITNAEEALTKSHHPSQVLGIWRIKWDQSIGRAVSSLPSRQGSSEDPARLCVLELVCEEWLWDGVSTSTVDGVWDGRPEMRGDVSADLHRRTRASEGEKLVACPGRVGGRTRTRPCPSLLLSHHGRRRPLETRVKNEKTSGPAFARLTPACRCIETCGHWSRGFDKIRLSCRWSFRFG